VFVEWGRLCHGTMAQCMASPISLRLPGLSNHKLPAIFPGSEVAHVRHTTYVSCSTCIHPRCFGHHARGWRDGWQVDIRDGHSAELCTDKVLKNLMRWGPCPWGWRQWHAWPLKAFLPNELPRRIRSLYPHPWWANISKRNSDDTHWATDPEVRAGTSQESCPVVVT